MIGMRHLTFRQKILLYVGLVTSVALITASMATIGFEIASSRKDFSG